MRCADERHDDADRQVDEEVPAPVDLGERATEDEADGRSGARHGGEDAHRLVAFLAGGEGRRDQREGVRGGEGAAEALDRTRATSIWDSVCAMPATSEAIVKSATPQTNIRRRP